MKFYLSSLIRIFQFVNFQACFFQSLFLINHMFTSISSASSCGSRLFARTTGGYKTARFIHSLQSDQKRTASHTPRGIYQADGMAFYAPVAPDQGGAPQGKLHVDPSQYPTTRRDETIVDNFHGVTIR